jgi:hypothetical protein
LATALPELAAVRWRPLTSHDSLRRTERLWTLTTVAHTVPMLLAAVGLFLLAPLTAPVGLVLVIHAWVIPELYAARGANVVKARRRSDSAAEQTALGLLGDLVGHEPRDLHARTGLVLERGRLGVWLLGEAGAVLVRPGGRRTHAFCVRVSDDDLPRADRVAHLLLALRSDERGFATVANLAFSGARWRLRRRLPERGREALDAAAHMARTPAPYRQEEIRTA